MDPKEKILLFTALISTIILLLFIGAFTTMILKYHRRKIAVQEELVRRNIDKLERDRRGLTKQIKSQLLQTATINTIDLTAIDQMLNILYPVRLQNMGLNAAFQDLCDMIQSNYSLKSIYIASPIPRFDESKEIHIYRLIEEILENAALHSSAEQILLKCSLNHGILSIVVSDDGIGFNMKSVKLKKKAYGLQHIIARSDLLDAVSYIEPSDEGGTSYVIQIPIS